MLILPSKKIVKPAAKSLIRPSRRAFFAGAMASMFTPAVVRAGSMSLLGAGKASVGGGGPTTLFSASPALNADDSNPNYSFRICCPVTGSSATQIRATFQPGSTGSQVVLHASIGKRDPSEPLHPNTLSTPLQLLFSGGSGFTASVSSITSDWLTISGFTLTTGDEVIVICDNSSPASQRFNNANTGVTTFYQSGTSWNTANTIGLGFTNLNNVNYGIVSVETQ